MAAARDGDEGASQVLNEAHRDRLARAATGPGAGLPELAGGRALAPWLPENLSRLGAAQPAGGIDTRTPALACSGPEPFGPAASGRAPLAATGAVSSPR